MYSNELGGGMVIKSLLEDFLGLLEDCPAGLHIARFE